MNRIRYLWEEIRGSFWFVPMLILLLAVGAALGFISLDQQLRYAPQGALKFLFAGSANSARSILSTIASAMIGVAGTVFSITLVALTLASSQFGSRLLRNFMYDKLNQVVLGTFVSSFVYCLLVLNAVTDTDQLQFVPVISVFVAIVAAIANIILLIIFIHHIAVSIQSDHVISNISSTLLSSIKKLYPHDAEPSRRVEESEMEATKQRMPCRDEIQATASGYLQSVDHESLSRIAQQHDLMITLSVKPGDYLVQDLRIGEVYAPAECSDELNKKIKDAFVIGRVRTSLQDTEFSIHQMVEIAVRALSPGINDPYTAMACIDNLTAVMCYLVKAKFPGRYSCDSDGKLRVVIDNLTFEGMLDAAFNQIRQCSDGSPAVVIRITEALITIDKMAAEEKHKQAIKKHMLMVLKVAKRTFHETQDLSDLQERLRKSGSTERLPDET